MRNAEWFKVKAQIWPAVRNTSLPRHIHRAHHEMESHSFLSFLVTYQTNNGVRSTIALSLKPHSFNRQIFEGTIAQGFCLYTDYGINSLNTERG
jgi:hypothetical protein